MKVTINRNSWHYRWYNKLRGGYFEEPKAVCNYFWGFIGINMLALLSIITIVAGLGLLLTFIVMPFFDFDKFIEIIKTIGIIMLVGALPSALFLYICSKVEDYLDSRPRKVETKKEKETGVIKGMFYAVKNKICPMIEYKN